MLHKIVFIFTYFSLIFFFSVIYMTIHNVSGHKQLPEWNNLVELLTTHGYIQLLTKFHKQRLFHTEGSQAKKVWKRMLQCIARSKTSEHTDATDLSLILFVRSTASMSMRILYLTCGGTLVVQGYMSMKTTPAQNLFSSSRYKAWWIIWDSSVYATNLSRLTHYREKRVVWVW